MLPHTWDHHSSVPYQKKNWYYHLEPLDVVFLGPHAGWGGKRSKAK